MTGGNPISPNNAQRLCFTINLKMFTALSGGSGEGNVCVCLCGLRKECLCCSLVSDLCVPPYWGRG